MKKKDRKPTSAGQKSLQQTRAENKATKVFNAELQKAVAPWIGARYRCHASVVEVGSGGDQYIGAPFMLACSSLKTWRPRQRHLTPLPAHTASAHQHGPGH